MSQRQTLCDYFDEDVVIKWTPTGRLLFGLVVESSENASDSEDEDSDDDSYRKQSSTGDKWRHLRPGFAKIAVYPNGNTVVVKEAKVKLYDRSLLNGDVVQRLDPKTRKLSANNEHGFCSSSNILATIKILGTNKVIENVDSNELQMLLNISEDTVCLLDAWLGYVKEVDLKITLKCRDGSLLTISDLDISEFDDLLTQRENNDSEFNRDDYYIGQQLYGPKRYLKNGQWIHQSKRMKQFMSSDSVRHSKINVVVEDISIDSVSVNWLCCLSDDTLPKNKSHNCDINSSFSVNKSTIRQSRDSYSNTGSHPIGDVVRGEAIKRIKCLNYFRKSSLQLGHLCYHTVRPNESITTFSEWMAKESNRLSEEYQSTTNATTDSSDAQLNERHASIGSSLSDKQVKKSNKPSLSLRKIRKKKLYASHRRNSYLLPISTSVGSRVPIEIVGTNTRVTVVWQSSAIEEDIPSINLYPVHHIDNHDFFPGDYVVENKDISESFNYGVIQSCDAVSRTATVKWFSISSDSQSAQFVAEQELSVYDIKDHPDFSFRSGVCVVRMQGPNEEPCEPCSRAGQVIDMTTEGQVMCAWLDNTTSLVWPQQLFIVGDYDSDDLWANSDSEFDYSDYDFDSDKSWETDDEDVNGEETTKRKKTSSKSSPKADQNQSLMKYLYNYASQVEDWVKSGSESISWHKLLAILKKVETCLDKTSNEQLSTHLSNKIQELSRRLKQLLPFSRTERSAAQTTNAETNDNKEDENATNSSSTSTSNERSFSELLDDLKTELMKNEIGISDKNGDTDHNYHKKDQSEEPEECEPSLKEDCHQMSPMNGANGVISEKRGNVIFMETVPECHKYFHTSVEPKNPKEFLKQIRFEINLMKSAIPKGIDVVLFESRIDLLSVLVVGPKETPYEDGLFLFDIQLPSNYPNGPPVVHYVSFCSDRLNPNLYESGKVCISLLGTWTGKGTEVWAPNTSNLLQVIVSIQGLILVSEPYYNEAGYSRQKGTAVANENSRLYNEMVVIKLIQSMTKMMATPPKTFETQIREHMTTVGDKFIERNENWAKISELCISQSIQSVDELLEYQESSPSVSCALPAFPLLPASHGFCLSLNKAIQAFKLTLKNVCLKD